LSYCSRSSLPTHVLAWLVGCLAHLLPPRPPGRGGTPPLPLEVHLDAVAAVLLDGLSYRRAGRMVDISKTEVGDSMDLLLGELAALGYCQPDGTFVVTLQDLRERLTSQDRHAPAGRADTPVTGLERTGSYQVTHAPSGRVHIHAALPGQADRSRDDTTVRAVQGQTPPAGPAPSSGTTAIFTGGSGVGGRACRRPRRACGRGAGMGRGIVPGERGGLAFGRSP
jgi:hypothetical protein